MTLEQMYLNVNFQRVARQSNFYMKIFLNSKSQCGMYVSVSLT